MPRNVRNWWIEGEIDGRGLVKVGGPRAADGGFRLTVYQRDRGDVATACVLRGWVDGSGVLRLDVEPTCGEGSIPGAVLDSCADGCKALRFTSERNS